MESWCEMGKLYLVLSIPVLAAWIFYQFYAGQNPDLLANPNFLSLPFPFWSTVLFSLSLVLFLDGIGKLEKKTGA
jgi:hypothetical protein